MFETLPSHPTPEITESDRGSRPAREREGSPPPVLAIAGAGLSGSTLLCRMLGELPGFVAIGEVGRIWERASARISTAAVVDHSPHARSGRRSDARRSEAGTDST